MNAEITKDKSLLPDTQCELNLALVDLLEGGSFGLTLDGYGFG